MGKHRLHIQGLLNPLHFIFSFYSFYPDGMQVVDLKHQPDTFMYVCETPKACCRSYIMYRHDYFS